jgi:hypothetical protein
MIWQYVDYSSHLDHILKYSNEKISILFLFYLFYQCLFLIDWIINMINMNSIDVICLVFLYCTAFTCPHALIWHSSFPSPSKDYHRIAAHVFINQAWMVARWQKAKNSDMIWLYVFFHLSNQNVQELPDHSRAQHTSSKYGHPENPNCLLRLHHLRLPILQMFSSCSEQKCSTACSLAPL